VVAPTLVALALLTALAARAGASDGFHFFRPIEAGDRYLQPAVLLPGQPVLHGNGYDGQFSFVLAEDPFLRNPATAASLDNTFRVRRILYPLLAWLLALGQRMLVPYTLVVVNLVAGTALAALLALAAVRAGKSPWWCLVAVLYPGVWIPVLLDLNEPLQLALLAAGMMAPMARLGDAGEGQRPLKPWLLFAATLSKDTAGVALVTEAVRSAVARAWRQVALLAGLAGAYLAWALVVFLTVKGTPYNDLGAHFLDPPGAPFRLLAKGSVNAIVLLPALLVALLALARPVRFRDGAAWAGAAYALLVLGAGNDTWLDPAAYFRVSAGALVLTYLSWVRTSDRLGLAAMAAGLLAAALSLPAVLAR